jgi:cyclase
MHQTCYSGAALTSAALLGLGASYGRAQDLPELTVETPVQGVHVIHGHPGGNVLVVETAKGLVLVDAQSADVGDSLVSAVRNFSAIAPAFVINTHYHEDHIAGNSVFREMGAETVAHRNVTVRASVDTTIDELQWHREPAESDDLPMWTIAGDTTVTVGGVRMDLFTFPAAHTDGDLAVYLPEQNVLHTGDILEVDAFPFIDWWGGGSLTGTVAAIDNLLALVDDETTIVPGHGHVVDRVHMAQYRAMLAEVGEGVQEAIERGDDARTTMSLGLASDFAGGRGGESAARRFVGILYLGMSAGLR